MPSSSATLIRSRPTDARHPNRRKVIRHPNRRKSFVIRTGEIVLRSHPTRERGSIDIAASNTAMSTKKTAAIVIRMSNYGSYIRLPIRSGVIGNATGRIEARSPSAGIEVPVRTNK